MDQLKTRQTLRTPKEKERERGGKGDENNLFNTTKDSGRVYVKHYALEILPNKRTI